MFARCALACQEESVMLSSWCGFTFPWRSVLLYTPDDLTDALLLVRGGRLQRGR